ncbi:MAG: thiamine phosphate synthase [Planctomycetota bacterium]|nr:MAG: thiamine phosphate synthase [Planctomycetota bacterium]
MTRSLAERRAELARLWWISPGDGLGPQLEQRLRTAVRAGLRGFQLREKGSFAGELHRAAETCVALMGEGYCLVNDRVDVALAAGAHGVHLGTHALPVAAARRLLGAEPLIGASIHNEAELERAQAEGADFVFASPVYPVQKPGRKTMRPLGLPRLQRLLSQSQVPVLALGGIRPERVAELMDLGVHGVAVLSGIGRAEDAALATRAYLEALGEG